MDRWVNKVKEREEEKKMRRVCHTVIYTAQAKGLDVGVLDGKRWANLRIGANLTKNRRRKDWVQV